MPATWSKACKEVVRRVSLSLSRSYITVSEINICRGKRLGISSRHLYYPSFRRPLDYAVDFPRESEKIAVSKKGVQKRGMHHVARCYNG